MSNDNMSDTTSIQSTNSVLNNPIDYEDRGLPDEFCNNMKQFAMTICVDTICSNITSQLYNHGVDGKIDKNGLQYRIYMAMMDSIILPTIKNNDIEAPATTGLTYPHYLSSDPIKTDDEDDAYDAYDGNSGYESTFYGTYDNDIARYSGENRCLECGVDMGPDNPRQLCRKTYCDGK